MKLRLPWWLYLIAAVAVCGLAWWAVASLFNGDWLKAIVGLLGSGLTIAGAAQVKRDPGRPTRGDLGARGVTVKEVKDEHGNVKHVEKRDRPYRGGGSGFF